MWCEDGELMDLQPATFDAHSQLQVKFNFVFFPFFSKGKKGVKKQVEEGSCKESSAYRRDNGVLGPAAMGPAATRAAGSADR